MKLHRHFDPRLQHVMFVPLVNVLFLLVMFYAMSTRFIVQPGLAVSLPVSAYTVGARPAAQLVTITAVPAPAIYFRDEKVSLAELSDRLAVLELSEKSLVLKADRSVPHEIVLRVMNVALDNAFSVVLATELPPEMKAAAQRRGSIFAWDAAGASFAGFVGFAALSVVLHALPFVLFHVGYPETATLPPSAPEVSLLTPGTPGAEALLRWVQAEDPALSAGIAASLPPALLELKYTPSFAIQRTAPQTIPEPPALAQYPPPRDPLALILRAEAAPVASRPAPPEAAEARVTFSAALAPRSLAEPPQFSPRKLTAAPAVSARFLVGVTARGEVPFVFPQTDPGEALDARVLAEMAVALSRATFAPDAAAPELTWGFAKISWSAAGE